MKQHNERNRKENESERRNYILRTRQATVNFASNQQTQFITAVLNHV